MLALIKESRMNQPTRNLQNQNWVRLPLDLTGPYVFDEVFVRTVRCTLQIDHSEVAIDIPAEVVRKLGLSGADSEVVLRIPGESTVAVNVRPILTESQRKSAAGWTAEMGDFDRF